MESKSNSMAKAIRAIGRRTVKQKKRRVARTVQNLTLVFRPGRLYNLPFPMIYKTFLTGQGFCYTGSGAGTGDYLWSVPLNYSRFPFAGMTTGLTWNNLTPASYNCVGFSTLLNGNMYFNYSVEAATLFLDVNPQSVGDNVACTISPSTSSSIPGSVASALTLPWTKQLTAASGKTFRLGDFPLRAHYQVHELIGCTKSGYDNDLSQVYTATYNTSPSKPYYFVINIETGDNAILGSALEVKIKVVYHVKLWELNTAGMI